METYNGHVRTPQDAIILFEACRIGMLPRVQRRLSEKERQSIRSGSVFVWDEREAGMRRWTDGKSWSASRVSGSFLTYREMEGKRGGSGYAPATKTPESGRNSGDDGQEGEEGPDGYRYKPDGLMKQSFSITTSTNQHLHLISYYSRSHPNAPGLQQPSTDPNLRTVRPAKGLYPETTLSDQQNVPAVTRSPMTGASPYATPQPPAGYPRPVVAHPHGYAYASQPHHYPMTSLQSPPNGYAPPQYANGYGAPSYGQTGLPPMGGPPFGVPQYPPHPPVPIPQAPPNSLDQRPPRSRDGNANSSPTVPRPHQYPGGSDQTAIPLQFQTSPHPSESRSPQAAVAPIDPRLMSTGPPTAPAASPTNGDTSAVSTQSPTENKKNKPEPVPQENGASPNSATQAPKSDTLVRTASGDEPAAENGTSTETNDDEAASMSPGGTTKKVEGPADIPSQKLAFGEDKRALKALDKVFI